MKVKQLRLLKGCYAFGGTDNIMGTGTNSIELLGGGNFLVNFNGKLVFVPNGQVHFAVCEPDDKKK